MNIQYQTKIMKIILFSLLCSNKLNVKITKRILCLDNFSCFIDVLFQLFTLIKHVCIRIIIHVWKLMLKFKLQQFSHTYNN